MRLLDQAGIEYVEYDAVVKAVTIHERSFNKLVSTGAIVLGTAPGRFHGQMLVAFVHVEEDHDGYMLYEDEDFR